MEPTEFHPLHRDLSAFADGELDPAATDRLLRQMASDPATVQELHRLWQLTATARRAVRTYTPPPSEALQERLRQILNAEAPLENLISAWPARAMRGGSFMLPRAAAAIILLAIGIWIGRSFVRSSAPVSQRIPEQNPADVIPASVISQAEEIHGFCSRLAEGLHCAGYPADIAPLAAAVERDLHSDHPYPNLTPIGYRYRGAGPCGKPMPDTAHLLYRSLQPGSVRAISVFVQSWRGQYPLEAGRLYTVSIASDPFPMLAWRTADVVYFLLADDAATEQAAAALIRGGPVSGPAPLPQ